MSSKSTRNRQRRKLTRAEIKAYQSRRAAERQRISTSIDQPQSGAEGRDTRVPLANTSYSMTRDEEFAVIKADLMRLLVITAVLVVILIGATVVLR